MSNEKIAISRPLVGALAIACFGAALGIWLFAADKEQESNQLWLSAFIRVGLLMSAFWMALPSRHGEAAWANVSPWTFVGIILAAVFLPRLKGAAIPLLIILATIGYFLRPRGKPRPTQRANHR